jgi:hypothetical protein
MHHDLKPFVIDSSWTNEELLLHHERHVLAELMRLVVYLEPGILTSNDLSICRCVFTRMAKRCAEIDELLKSQE